MLVRYLIHFGNVCLLSHVRFFATSRTVANQAPISMQFSRQEYWSGLLFLSPGDLFDPGIKPTSLVSLALAGGFFTTSATWEAHFCLHKVKWSESCSAVSNSLLPHGLYSPWNSLRKNTRVDSQSHLQGIFPTQGLNPGLPHCRNTVKAPRQT